MGRYLAQRLNTDISELGYDKLTSKEIKEKLGEITFFTATDGNHGRGVAWTANKLGQKSVVLMPKGSSEFRLNKIKGEGADASITDLNYDDAVRLANDYAEADDHGVMVQDTAWDGYEEIPAWIMQGYGTMAQEAIEQLKEYGVDRPTHVFVQAGVGSLAGAVQGYVASIYDECPITVVVEADEADCYYKSAEAGDGKPRFVGGDMPTIMAGLACGEPNTIGFEVLKNHAAAFVSAPDWVSAKGMRTLGNPLNGDEKVISGESGAVTTGLLVAAMEREDLADLRKDLKLDENSRILLISTEGDTDPDKYRSIVWDGEYPSI
ncbi:diaminopropionate ammonia-lyase family protein [Clostridioides difficile CD181]|nr:diaminopropionate ammonia-lyase family protein [Clostridioides difficile CD47]EQF50360.1 diaminopropionate ammonia-lyase family protein [Clostridioides difficile CD181]